MADQQRILQRAQQFEQESTNTMERLTTILLQLEQRTIQPRNLDLDYEQYVPRKRQNIRDTPTTTTHAS